MLITPMARMAGALMSLCLMLAAVLCSLILGHLNTSASTLIESIFNHDPGSVAHIVIWTERVSRTTTALVVGAGLAVVGTLMQTITRNPLASPGILGINAGAMFFVVIGATLFSLTLPSELVGLAVFGATFSATLVYLLGREASRGMSPVRTVLAGVAISALFVSFAQGLLILNQGRFESILFWLAGSVSGRDLTDLMPLIPVFVTALLVTLLLAPKLNLLGLDDEVVLGLGLNIGRIRLILGALVVILAGTSVAVAGMIGFVGLIVPHITRGLFGPDHRWLLPMSAILGSVLLLAADTASRLIIPPQEIPVGVVTALMGTPLFLHLARNIRKTS